MYTVSFCLLLPFHNLVLIFSLRIVRHKCVVLPILLGSHQVALLVPNQCLVRRAMQATILLLLNPLVVQLLLVLKLGVPYSEALLLVFLVQPKLLFEHKLWRFNACFWSLFYSLHLAAHHHHLMSPLYLVRSQQLEFSGLVLHTQALLVARLNHLSQLLVAVCLVPLHLLVEPLNLHLVRLALQHLVLVAPRLVP